MNKFEEFRKKCEKTIAALVDEKYQQVELIDVLSDNLEYFNALFPPCEPAAERVGQDELIVELYPLAGGDYELAEVPTDLLLAVPNTVTVRNNLLGNIYGGADEATTALKKYGGRVLVRREA